MAKSYTAVFAVRGLEYLRDGICLEKGFKAGNLTEDRWSNGEYSRELAPPDRKLALNRNVVLIGSTDEAHFLQMCDFGWELARVAKSLTFLIPFYRYSTMERREKSKPGRVVIPKIRAIQLSQIRSAKEINRVLLCDLHTSHIEHYFDPAKIEVDTIDCEELISESIRSLAPDELVIGATDGGRPDWILGTSARLGLPFALLNKKRLSGTETMVLGSVNGDVSGKIVAMRDDMIRSGGTTLDAAQKYLKAGAKEVWIVATHPDFSPGAIDRLRSSGLIKGVVVTDSYPTVHMVEQHHSKDGFLKVVPIAPFLAKQLRERGL